MNLKMAVSGSRSTSNYSAIVNIQIGKMRLRKVEMTITPVSDYDILLSMNDLMRMGVVIDCQQNSIYFTKHKVRVHCNGNSAQERSTITKAQEVPEFSAMFPEIFIKKLTEHIPTVRNILHRITLKALKKLSKTPIFKGARALMPKFKA